VLQVIGWCLGCALALLVSRHAAAADYRERSSADEVIYFLLVDRFANGDASNDRGGLGGDRLATGFDPTDSDNPRLGVTGTERRSYDPNHPLFRTIRELATLRRNEPALRRGTQVIRHDAARPGLLAFSRIDAATGRELLMVFNTATRAIRERIAIDPRTAQLVSLHGKCSPAPVAPGSYSLAMGPLDYIICAAVPAPRGDAPP